MPKEIKKLEVTTNWEEELCNPGMDMGLGYQNHNLGFITIPLDHNCFMFELTRALSHPTFLLI